MTFKSLITAALLLASTAAFAASEIVMHRDPGCGCCAKWAVEVERQLGRKVRVVDDAERSTLQRRLGVPAELSGCHTAIVDGMAFEGHVPIADMKRVLAARPKGVRGLAVPGMPMGSPGMEAPGVPGERYDVMAFGTTATKVFARH